MKTFREVSSGDHVRKVQKTEVNEIGASEDNLLTEHIQ
jgi:hypothetical protein